MPALGEDLLLKLCAVIEDPVTTTDELIPSGETSSYRSNPEALSEFALSRRVPEYVGRSKRVRAMETARKQGMADPDLNVLLKQIGTTVENTSVGSCIFARKPGDGSAREQAASCQKVLGGFANICFEYATKRYRSNCINWGIIPFTVGKEVQPFSDDEWVFVPGVREKLLSGAEEFDAVRISESGRSSLKLFCRGLSEAERRILAEGCLMNYYAAGYED